MPYGLAFSLLLHAAIIGWAVGAIGSAKPPPVPKVTPISVEILDVSDLTRIRKGTEKPKKPKQQAKPKPEPKKPKKVAEKKPVPPAKTKTASLAPKPSEPKKPAPVKPKAEPVKEKPVAIPKRATRKKRPEKPKKAEKPKKTKTAAKPKKTPPAKSKQKKQAFDPERIAALLNKIPDASNDRTEPAKKKKSAAPVEIELEETVGQADGAGQELTISEFDFFMRQIGNCWNPPVGAVGARELIPVIGFDLKRDGSLNGTPRVVNGQNSPFFLAAADAAIRAIVACQPYHLPKEKYDDWAHNEITFDPQAMFGG